jgi:hypothetical protein
MGSPLKFTILLLGVIFIISVVYLLVNRRINERNSFLWLAGSLGILVLAAIPDILEIMADLTGVDYPPTLLFLLSILVILFILLYQSVQISILQDKCRELAQHLAIMNFHNEKPAKVHSPKQIGKKVGQEKHVVQSD